MNPRIQRRTLLRLSAGFLGAAASGGLARALAAGASVAAGAAARFGEAHAASVRLLAEMIIPQTDTPGAVEAGVPDFIATIVFDWYTPGERKAFMQGLAALDGFCMKQASQPFHLAAERTRVAALQEQERLALAARSEQAGQAGQAAGDPYPSPQGETGPFFNRLRELVVFGYYTSELGATKELIYSPVPGRYQGDVDFSQVGRQWAY